MAHRNAGTGNEDNDNSREGDDGDLGAVAAKVGSGLSLILFGFFSIVAVGELGGYVCVFEAIVIEIVVGGGNSVGSHDDWKESAWILSINDRWQDDMMPER